MKMLKQSLFVAALALSWSAEPAAAQAASAGSAVEAASEAILANGKVIKALEDIKADDEAALAEQKRITEIPAPPYKENRRAEYVLKRFVELGFKEASIDAEGNVIALRKGSGGGRPKLVVSAHLDTVFPEGTDIDGFISIDGLGVARVVNQATGSHRYEMIFKGPGGHSFQEFGLPSAIHAMGRAIARISDLQTPSDPKTTFTVGTVNGGTSVNAIAAEAKMTVDMRSNSTEELLKLEARLLDLVKQAAVEENARWKSDKLSVEIKLIGDRPAGIVALDAPIVQATQRAVAAIARGPRVTFAGSSTDSNLAMSLGIPAVTIGGGGEGGNWHSRNEWYKPVEAYLGPQSALLTILVLTGLDGATKPALAVRRVN
jgi:acetylornithine deacetylase/succinyl-diaminopimelate desuccinylase-like protein